MDGQQLQARATERAQELPGAEITYPFGEGWDVYKVRGKVFMLQTELSGEPIVILKATPDDGLALRSAHNDISPGYHMNKQHWITLHPNGDIDEDLVDDPVTESYLLVIENLPDNQHPVDPPPSTFRELSRLACTMAAQLRNPAPQTHGPMISRYKDPCATKESPCGLHPSPKDAVKDRQLLLEVTLEAVFGQRCAERPRSREAGHSDDEAYVWSQHPESARDERELPGDDTAIDWPTEMATVVSKCGPPGRGRDRFRHPLASSGSARKPGANCPLIACRFSLRLLPANQM